MSIEEVTGRKRKAPYCDFCGKAQDEVLILLAGPNTFICDECVADCNDIIIKRKIQAGATAVIGKTVKNL